MAEIKDAKELRIDYTKRKKDIIKLLDRGIEFYETEQEEKNKDALAKLKSDLQNGEFSIVVVGEFSAGKSTLLNALMGKRILPSWLNETTATVNFLRHKEKAQNGEAGRIFYQNGAVIEIPEATVETIEKYVSTKGDEVAGKVSHVDLYLDSEFLKDGVTLVDSPGLNGTADGHREITEAQILKSHASIFLFSSDHPGTKTDFEFLHDLQKKVKTIIFVLNKIDDIKIEENETVESIINTLKKSYKKQFPDESTVPEIWPVAAREALYARDPKSFGKNENEEERERREKDSRLISFENRLIQFLTCGEKAYQQMMSPVERVIAIASESRKSFEDEIQTLQKVSDAGEVENKIEELRAAADKISLQIADSRKQIFKSIIEGMRDVKEEFAADLTKLQENKHAEIDTFDNLDELEEYLSRFEDAYLKKVYSLALECEEVLRQKFIEIVRLQYSKEAVSIELEQSSSDLSMNVTISTHLETENEIFEVGLQELSKKIEVAEQNLKALKKEAEHAEADYFRARDDQRKRDKIETEIKNLEAGKEALTLQMLPPIERYTEEQWHRTSRGGLLGTAADFLFGKKKVAKYVQVTNSDDRQAAEAQRDKQIDEKNRAIDERKAQVACIKDTNVTVAELKQKQKLAEVEECRQSLIELRQENMEIIDRKTKAEIRKIKRKLDDYCETISREIKKQMTSELHRLESHYVSAIAETVEANLKKKLAEKQERLSQLEKQLSASERSRNERINQLRQKIEQINEILGEAADVKASLMGVEIDQIGVETLFEEE